MPTICRCGLVAKLLLTRPSVSSVSVRFKYNQPFEAPEWKDIALRENAYGRETFITRTDKERFDYYNEVVWPPHHKERGEEKKGEHFYCRENVKHSWQKLWYPCVFIRNRPIDEAIKQLEFFSRKGAVLLRECLLEAQEEAVKENKIEFRSNMWVVEAFPLQSLIIKGVRRHARARYGIVKYRYSDIFLRLEEGKPPEEYRGRHMPFGGWNMMKEYVQQMRDRRINFGL